MAPRIALIGFMLEFERLRPGRGRGRVPPEALDRGRGHRRRRALAGAARSRRLRRLLPRHGRDRAVAAGSARDDERRRERPRRAGLLRPLRAARRGTPAGRAPRRRRLHPGAWRLPRHRRPRSRGHAVCRRARNRRAGGPGRGDARPARQRLAPDGRGDRSPHRLPDQPPYRPRRARSRGRPRHARAPCRHADGQGLRQAADPAAAGGAALRPRPLRRGDRQGPEPGRRADPQRLGARQFQLRRLAEDRHVRRRHGPRRPGRGGRARARARPGPVGRAPPLHPSPALDRGGDAAHARRAAPIRQSRPCSLPTSPTIRAAAGAATRPPSSRASSTPASPALPSRSTPIRRSWRRRTGAASGRASRPSSTATRRTQARRGSPPRRR